MPPTSKPLPDPAVVPCRCIAMAVALEVVAEHRRWRAQADLRAEEELARERLAKLKKAHR